MSIRRKLPSVEASVATELLSVIAIVEGPAAAQAVLASALANAAGIKSREAAQRPRTLLGSHEFSLLLN